MNTCQHVSKVQSGNLTPGYSGAQFNCGAGNRIRGTSPRSKIGSMARAVWRAGTCLPRVRRKFGDFAALGLALLVVVMATHASAAGSGQAGQVRAWYYDFEFGYGKGTVVELTLPPGLGDCTAVAVGGGHFAAIRASGAALVMWGANNVGQAQVPGNLGPCGAVDLGESHTLAITSAGVVRAWGSNSHGQAVVPPGLGPCSAIAAGGQHSLAIRNDGTVIAWGSNEQGQSSVPFDLIACTQVAAGDSHSVALQVDGTLRAWGAAWNDCGQVEFADGVTDVRSVAAGGERTGAIRHFLSNSWWGCGSCMSLPWDKYGYSSVTPGDINFALTRDARIVGNGLVLDSWCTGFDSVNDPSLFPSNTERWSELDAHGNMYIGIENDDCDSSGTADSLELEGHDCNGNGFLDACDAANGLIEDCNENGLGDTCEKQLWVKAQSPVFQGLGYPASFVWTIPEASFAASWVEVWVHASGDLESVMETVRLQVGTEVDIVLFGHEGDFEWIGFCEPAERLVGLSPQQLNAAISLDGTLQFTLTPSIAVDANACPQGSWIQLELRYFGANSADCNGNGLLDSCEIANGWAADANSNGRPDECESPLTECPTDLDGNGLTDGADLGTLLGAWGPALPGALADLNHDGIVDGADLGTLLGGWGSCAQ